MKLDNKKLKFAKLLARIHHDGQMYSPGKKYYKHLWEVDRIVKICHDTVSFTEKYGLKIRILAFLHDIIEDTDIDYNYIQCKFDTEMADAVLYLTDPSFSTRKQRKEVTNFKLKHIPKEFEYVLIVKAADRLANVRSGMKNKMYSEEYDDFRAAVYRPGLCDTIWEEIDTILDKHVIIQEYTPDTKTMTLEDKGCRKVTVTEFERLKREVDINELSYNEVI